MIDRLLRARVPLLLSLGMAAFLIVSYGYEPEERALPVLVAWVTMVFLVLEMLVQAQTALGRRIETILQGSNAETAPELPPMQRALRYAVGWTALLVTLIVLIGILPAVFVYVGLSLKLDGAKSSLVSLATALAVTLFAWLLFEWGLSYDLYRGVFA